jgi:hypothetical protein
MLNFQAVRDNKMKVQDLVRDLTREDMRRELNEMYDEIERLIKDCTEAQVTFEPTDEKADDPYAVEGEESIAWTLGHVIVHVTASMEEAASDRIRAGARSGTSWPFALGNSLAGGNHD